MCRAYLRYVSAPTTAVAHVYIRLDMDTDGTKVFLEKAFQTSTGVTGFVVLQSLVFSYAMAGHTGVSDRMESTWVSIPFFLMGLLILLGAYFAVSGCHSYIERQLSSESEKSFNRQQRNWRLVLVAVFGSVPPLMIVFYKWVHVA